MKLWIDDVREPPQGWTWARSVNQAIGLIKANYPNIEIISLDHDAGDFYKQGGDYIKVLDWAEDTYGWNFNTAIHLHTMNVIGRANMKRIIQHNDWKEIDNYGMERI